VNLPGILLPKSIFFALLLVSLFVSASFAQKKKKVEFTERTSFSAEEEKFEHSVPLNESAKKALASEQSITDVLREEKLAVENIPEDWFTASEVHLSSTAEVDLVIMGTHFARGAYTSTFWVLRKSAHGYAVVLRDSAHDLTLQETTSHGLRNILTDIVTLRYGSTAEYEFDGDTYRITKRTSEPNGRVPRTDPTKYQSHKEFIQAPGQDPEPMLAQARAWIWQRWRDQELSYVRVSMHGDDGEEQDCSYFIDRDSENGEMQITLKIHRTAWNQDSPSRSRYLVMEDYVSIANEVRRTEPSEGNDQSPRVLSAKEEMPASKYRLQFMEDGVINLLTL
jgi:hypothetical protein